MTYKGIVKGRTIELEESLPYSEGQPVSVSVEPLRLELQRGSALPILKVMRDLPRLDSKDVDALEQAIEEGKLPVRNQGELEEVGAENRE